MKTPGWTIIDDVAAAHGLTRAEMLARGTRDKRVLRAREEAIWFLHHSLGYGPSKIARLVGRDHSSVIVSLRRADAHDRVMAMQAGEGR